MASKRKRNILHILIEEKNILISQIEMAEMIEKYLSYEHSDIANMVWFEKQLGQLKIPQEIMEYFEINVIGLIKMEEA